MYSPKYILTCLSSPQATKISLNNGEFIIAELELNIVERHKKCGKAKEMNFSSNRAELELNIVERHKKCGKAKEMNFSSNN